MGSKTQPSRAPLAMRRQFLGEAAGAAAGSSLATIFGPLPGVHAGASDTIRIGLVGCGGRGSGAAVQAMNADPGCKLVAMGDLFRDRLQSSRERLKALGGRRFDVPDDRCFIGFDAYRHVIDCADVVLLATPPGFRPQHFKAAVEAGKHSFLEITAGVDAPGVRTVLESAELARKKNLAVVSGFCWRYNFALRAAAERIHDGAIGELRALYATYYRGKLYHKYPGPRGPSMTELEWQIRDWYGYLWLSGDVTIVGSGGHSVDKMSWWLRDQMPTKAVAVGGRVVPIEGQNTFDHAFVAYEYASGIRGFLGCRSLAGCYNENADYVIGTKGICTIGRGRMPVIEGETNWRYQGPQNNMYQTEHDELFASIRAGKPINDGIRMAHTTLMALMGRMAAYTGREITWEQALGSQQKLVPDQLDWDTKIDTPPLAVPGTTTFS
ncbi:MAG TPA: Gfo/Idh/MocA family oxidoreductase [Planctomycetes bacterium]|nr:Gfo/Idh/MocA family oxidoreductase [Planctomycetota bacterium]